MFFEELVQQHGVHRFVAHGVNFACFITSNQIRIHLFHVLGHKAELRDAIWVEFFLVVEGDRFQREDRFAGLVHGLNRFLETLRGNDRAEMTVGVYDYCYTCWNGCPSDSGDKCSRLILYPADTNSARLASQTSIADVDVFVAGGKIAARSKSQRDVLAASCVV